MWLPDLGVVSGYEYRCGGRRSPVLVRRSRDMIVQQVPRGRAAAAGRTTCASSSCGRCRAGSSRRRPRPAGAWSHPDEVRGERGGDQPTGEQGGGPSVQLIPAAPRPTRKRRLAATLTASSEVSTEPMTWRGSMRPSVSSAGVASRPGPSHHHRWRPRSPRTDRAGRGASDRAGRSSAVGRRPRSGGGTPRARRAPWPIRGAAAPVERLQRTVPPRNAPIAPGPAMRPTTRRSTSPRTTSPWG